MPRTTDHATPSPALSAVEDADVAIATTLAQERRHPLIRVAGAASELADQPPLIGLSGAVLGYGLLAGNVRITETGARMLAAVLLAALAKAAVKRAVSRTRPHVVMDTGHYEVRPLGPDEGPWHSFPSGHTAGAVAAAAAVVRVNPEARLAYGVAAAVAAVQVPRGAHYPLDVIAGAALGLAAEAVVDRFWPSDAKTARGLTAIAHPPPG